MLIGYHASHEQFPPAELLQLVQAAEQAGFQAAMASDHITPFSMRQGESGFVWSWLGAALATTGFSFGTVSAPGQRYHPAIIAQAIATLSSMFPERFWVALGSGQFINEHVTGETWPSEKQRDERLLECVTAIRSLLAGESVTHEGRVTLMDARLFSRPRIMPKLLGAAITVESARWVASWADGLITVAQPRAKLAEVIDAFRSNGGDGKPLFLQAQVSYDATYEAALDGAWDQWRMSALQSDQIVNASTPEEVDRMAKDIPKSAVAERVRVSADPEQHIEWLREDQAMGFDAVYIHNVNRKQQPFIEAFGATVIPAFR
jgi:coenzyme F420-dependent glucose-6-phosphate dehydrogenase